MNTLMTLFLALVVGSYAHSAEITIVTGSADGPMKTASSVIIAKAKELALSKLPHAGYRQVSEWSVTQYAEPRFQRKFISVEASFANTQRSGPYFTNVTENRLWTWRKDKFPELIEKSKARALKSAKFHCNSLDTSMATPWGVEVTSKKWDGSESTSYHVRTTARFQCGEPESAKAQ